MRARSDTEMCTHFAGRNKEAPRRLSIPRNKVDVLRLRFRTAARQQLSPASFRKTARYSVLVQVQDRRKPPELSFHSSQSPSRSQSAPVLLQVLHHQLSRRSVPRSSSVSGDSVPLLVSLVADETLQRSVTIRSQLVLSRKSRMHEAQRFTKQVLKQTVPVL